MFTKAPFRLPDGFLNAFGYRGGLRLVALYWEPCGDESCFDDGVASACGLADNWCYLDFVRQPHVQQWLIENDFHLGNSDEEAQQWLVVDAHTGEIHAGDWREASAAVRSQELP